MSAFVSFLWERITQILKRASGRTSSLLTCPLACNPVRCLKNHPRSYAFPWDVVDGIFISFKG